MCIAVFKCSTICGRFMVLDRRPRQINKTQLFRVVFLLRNFFHFYKQRNSCRTVVRKKLCYPYMCVCACVSVEYLHIKQDLIYILFTHRISWSEVVCCYWVENQWSHTALSLLSQTGTSLTGTVKIEVATGVAVTSSSPTSSRWPSPQQRWATSSSWRQHFTSSTSVIAMEKRSTP